MNTVLINLEILGTMEPNIKIGTEGAAVFVVYRPTFMATLARRTWGETRKLNVDRVELCVQHALAQLRGMCRGADAEASEQQRAIEHLSGLLRGATRGMRNLMATYADDVSTSARIRSLVDAIGSEMTNLGLTPAPSPPLGPVGAGGDPTD